MIAFFLGTLNEILSSQVILTYLQVTPTSPVHRERGTAPFWVKWAAFALQLVTQMNASWTSLTCVLLQQAILTWSETSSKQG